MMSFNMLKGPHLNSFSLQTIFLKISDHLNNVNEVSRILKESSSSLLLFTHFLTPAGKITTWIIWGDLF